MAKVKNKEKKEDIVADNGIDLYSLVQIHIGNELGKQSEQLFINDPSIVLIKSESADKQRFIINRYFYNLLLRFRSKHDVPVHNVMAMLVPDGTSDDWFKLFVRFVVPFLKTHNVMTSVLCSEKKS